MSMGGGTDFPVRGKGQAKRCLVFQTPETEKGMDALLFSGVFQIGNSESETTLVTILLGVHLWK